MRLSLWDPHHVMDILLVQWADAILHCNVLDGLVIAGIAFGSPLSLVAHVAVEKLVSVNLQMIK